MRTFQPFSVRGASGPVVTLQAGVDFAGYFWTTTSRTAAKVSALRRFPVASVLVRKSDSWVLRAGRSVVIDPAHPFEAIRELPVFALAGTALALIAARYPEQLLGYVADAATTPKAWKLHNRVLIAVRHDDELAWTDDGTITEQSARFSSDAEAHRAAARKHLAGRSIRHVGHASLLDVDGTCWLGLDSDAGPVVLPGEWKAARSAVGVPSGVLAAVHAHLPGRACITIDRSESRRPSEKIGIIARGDASPLRVRSASASIVVDVNKITTWSGFRSTVAAA
jgi:hypothetical protein